MGLVMVLGLSVLFTIISQTESQGAPEITSITIEKLLATIPGLKESLDKERQAEKTAKKPAEKAPAAPVTPPQGKLTPRRIPKVPARNARRLAQNKEKTEA